MKFTLNSFITIPDALNSDDNPRRLSSGAIEGLNAILEKININDNGYSNFWRFRNRSIYVINKDVSVLNTPKKKK